MSLDAQINFGNVVAGSPAKPAPINASYFYARWVGYLCPTVSGVYALGLNVQDGANLFIGDTPIISNLAAALTAHTSTAYNQSGTIELTAGVYYPLTVEWQHGSGSPYQLQLLWTPPGGSVQVVASANLSASQTSVTGNIAGSWWNGTSGLWYPSGPGVIDFTNQNQAGRGNLPAAYRAAVLGLSPKVYFRLSNIVGIYADESGNENIGSVVGTGTLLNASGLIAGDSDGAVQFAGTSDITVPNAVSLRNNIVTVVFWIKAAAGSQINTFGGACCMSGQSTTSPGWTFAQNNTLTTAIVAVATSANNNLVSNFPGTPFDGNTHMIAFGVDGSAGTLYLSIDGAVWSTVSFAANKGTGISNSVVPLLVGAQAGGGHAMVGVIDEFALFASILDQTDIAGLYALGIHGMNRSLANVPGQLNGSSNNNPVNSNGFLVGSNPLSQSGNTKTILVAAFTLKFGDGPVSYNAGSVTVSAYGEWFVYFHDKNYQGGTVTFLATPTQSDLTSANDIPTAFAINLLTGGGGVPSGGGGHIQFQ